MPSVVIHGEPIPQGSIRVGRGGGVWQDNRRTKPWRDDVAGVVARARELKPATREPVALLLRFTFARPSSHLTKTGALRKSARRSPSGRPDLDKLVRAVLDALSGVLYVDDAQVVDLVASKCYGFRAQLELSWDVLSAAQDPPPVAVSLRGE